MITPETAARYTSEARQLRELADKEDGPTHFFWKCTREAEERERLVGEFLDECYLGPEQESTKN